MSLSPYEGLDNPSLAGAHYSIWHAKCAVTDPKFSHDLHRIHYLPETHPAETLQALHRERLECIGNHLASHVYPLRKGSYRLLSTPKLELWTCAEAHISASRQLSVYLQDQDKDRAAETASLTPTESRKRQRIAEESQVVVDTRNDEIEIKRSQFYQELWEKEREEKRAMEQKMKQ